MKPETIFLIANYAAIAGWVLILISWFLPILRWPVIWAAIPLLLAVAYTTIVLGAFENSGGDFQTLAGVMKLFTSRWATLAGWIHYLCFDMFIGIWETADAKRNGLAVWLMLPVWFLTFMFGPVGLMLYLIIRTLKTRSPIF